MSCTYYDLSGPIVLKNSIKHQVSGPVLVPGEPDFDGDILSAEKIADLENQYMKNFRLVDTEHTNESLDAIPVESWLLMQSMTVNIDGKDVVLPKGTWMMTVEITNMDVWRKVKSGQITGFSVQGVNKKDAELVANAVDPKHETSDKSKDNDKRITFNDLENDFVVPIVSLVENPAVPKAHFYAIKHKSVDTTIKSKEVESMTTEEVVELVKTTISDQIATLLTGITVPEDQLSKNNHDVNTELSGKPVKSQVKSKVTGSGVTKGAKVNKGVDTVTKSDDYKASIAEAVTKALESFLQTKDSGSSKSVDNTDNEDELEDENAEDENLDDTDEVDKDADEEDACKEDEDPLLTAFNNLSSKMDTLIESINTLTATDKKASKFAAKSRALNTAEEDVKRPKTAIERDMYGRVIKNK